MNVRTFIDHILQKGAVGNRGPGQMVHRQELPARVAKYDEAMRRRDDGSALLAAQAPRQRGPLLLIIFPRVFRHGLLD